MRLLYDSYQNTIEQDLDKYTRKSKVAKTNITINIILSTFKNFILLSFLLMSQTSD